MRPLPAPTRLDAVLATGLLAWWLVEAGAGGALAATAAALSTLPLAWRRTAPVAAAAVAGTGSVVASLPEPPPEPLAQLVALLVSAFAVALHARDERAALLGGGLLAAGAGAGALLVGDGDLLFVLLLTGAAWGAGMAVRRPTGRSAVLEARAEALAREAELAAVEERRRIARELHDVVAHSVSLMVVQAGAAEQLLERDPAEARRALHAAQRTGRAAVDDLRRMLGLLREGPEASPAAPQPGLAALETLAGDGVELRREPLPDVPPGLDLAAFRIVQESLTNARRHAPGRPTTVAVACRDGALALEVRTLGVPAADPRPGGHGLVGMRERVALYGGALQAGPRDGDWVVEATLPVPVA